MSVGNMDDAWDHFSSSTVTLLAGIERLSNEEDEEEKLRVLGPLFFDWSNNWIKLMQVWFKWLKRILLKKYGTEDEENIPITKAQLQTIVNAGAPSDVISKENGLMTRVFYWANDEKSYNNIPENEEVAAYEQVWGGEPNKNILVPMKHWDDEESRGGGWKTPEDLKKQGLEVVKSYGYNRVKQLSIILLRLAKPDMEDDEILGQFDLGIRRRKRIEREREKLARKLDKAGFEYFQDPDVYKGHIKKLASRRVVCFSGKGAMGKSALAVQITKDLLATEGEGEERKQTKNGLLLKFPKFGTNYILKTTKSVEQGDLATYDEKTHKAMDKIAPKIHGIAEFMSTHERFDQLLTDILKKGEWTADKIRSAESSEKKRAALGIIRSTPIFILLDNYEDIEGDEDEKRSFDSFLKEYYETPETEAKKTYILITSRLPVDESVAEDSRIRYLGKSPSNDFLNHLLNKLPGESYEYQPWMIEYQAVLVASFDKMHDKLSSKFGPGQGGFPPLIGLIAHTFLSAKDKPYNTSWLDEIPEEVAELHGNKLNDYVYSRNSKQIRKDSPHSWKCLEDFARKNREFTEEDLLTELERTDAPEHEIDEMNIIGFLLECESRDLIYKTLHPETGEHLYNASISLSVSPGEVRKIESLEGVPAHVEKISELERELQNLETGHDAEEFSQLLDKTKKITLTRDFSVEDYDGLAKAILSLEDINENKGWGRDKATNELKTKHRNRGIRRIRSLDDLSFMRSKQFINDMIELAVESKKINFSTILERLAELVNATDSALLLEDELAAAGLQEVLIASVEEKEGLDRLALNSSGSKAWLSILGKLISKPGIQEREIQYFIDFCLRVIEVRNMSQEVLKERARKDLLTLREMLSELHREDDIFSAFEDATPIEWGGSSSIADGDFEPCKMVVIGKDLVWINDGSGTYSNDNEGWDSEKIILEGNLDPRDGILLCQVRKKEPGKLILRSIRYHKDDLTETEEKSITTEDMESSAGVIINRLVTDYPKYTHIAVITDGFAKELKLDHSISISSALRNLGLAKDMFDFIDKNCEGVKWQGSQVCKRRSPVSPKDGDESISKIREFDIDWIKRGTFLVPEDLSVAAVLITNLYNIVIDHGEKYWYDKDGKVKVKEWRRAVFEAFYDYNGKGEIFHKCNYIFHRFRFTLETHRGVVFSKEFGPVVLLAGYVIHLKSEKGKKKFEALIEYLKSVGEEITETSGEGDDPIHAISQLEEEESADMEILEDDSFLRPELWNWVISELVERGDSMSTFREWKANSMEKLKIIDSDLNRTLRDKIYSLAYSSVEMSLDDVVPKRDRVRWKILLMDDIIKSQASLLDYPEEVVRSIFEKVY